MGWGIPPLPTGEGLLTGIAKWRKRLQDDGFLGTASGDFCSGSRLDGASHFSLSTEDGSWGELAGEGKKGQNSKIAHALRVTVRVWEIP